MVIGNNAINFTVGANLMLIGMLAFQQEFDQLDMAVRLFQQTSMRCRYSTIPVVTATQGYVFGGGVELLMHCDASVCTAESYIGLVEMGVGLLPGVLGGETSAEIESFVADDKTIEAPHYTRPAEYNGMKVPDVLLSGNHAEIEKWRTEGK